MRSLLPLRSVFLSALLCAGCEGVIGDSIEPASPDSGACEEDAGTTAAARLSNRELERAISDLLGVSEGYASLLPSDNIASRYDNNAKAQQVSAAWVEGVFRASGAAVADMLASPVARQAVLTCTSGDACARDIVLDVARRAFRRTPQPEELDELMAPYATAISYGRPFDQAVGASLRAVLVSPAFLLRTVELEHPDTDAVESLSGVELVGRLAAFLWGSVPDAALLDLAESGWLDDRSGPEGRERVRDTVRQMLLDARSDMLLEAFFDEYLRLDRMREEGRQPSLEVFPFWSAQLEAAMLGETRTFLRELIRNDESPRALLTADYTFVNRALAEQIYDIDFPGADDQAFVKVALPLNRIGVLTQGTILTMTSNPERTSVVNRGLWVMENLMCYGVPSDPPEGVATEPPAIEGASFRERVEAHRSDPSCSVCHVLMDPIGFGLENFDAVGRYRTKDDDGFDVDARGELPSGESFSGPVELAKVIAASGRFERCLSRHLMEFALGRVLRGSDECAVERVGAAITPEARFSDLVTAIATSPAFEQQRGVP